MPSKEKYVVQVKGTDAYSSALYQLQRATGSTTLAEMTDRALRDLARKHGIDLPERIRPVGTNRFTTDQD